MRDEPIFDQGRSFASLVAGGAPDASLIEQHAMIAERAPGGSSLIDVLDRVLDKGIVIDAWVRVSLVGIDLLTVGSRIVVASIDTHLEHSAAVGTAPASLRSRWHPRRGWQTGAMYCTPRSTRPDPSGANGRGREELAHARHGTTARAPASRADGVRWRPARAARVTVARRRRGDHGAFVPRMAVATCPGAAGHLRLVVVRRREAPNHRRARGASVGGGPNLGRGRRPGTPAGADSARRFSGAARPTRFAVVDALSGPAAALARRGAAGAIGRRRRPASCARSPLGGGMARPTLRAAAAFGPRLRAAARPRAQVVSRHHRAVADPVLLTDCEGKLILANVRAEDLLIARDEDSEGRRRAVPLNNLLFSAALASKAVAISERTRTELLLVDPVEGSDLLFELLASPVENEDGSPAIVSVLRNVTDLGLATRQIGESELRLKKAQAEVRSERDRLDLILASVADPIVVCDAAGDIVLMNPPAEWLFTVRGNDREEVRRRVSGQRGALLFVRLGRALVEGSGVDPRRAQPRGPPHRRADAAGGGVGEDLLRAQRSGQHRHRLPRRARGPRAGPRASAGSSS